MAKFDPDKYVNDLTKTATGIAETLSKIDDKIKTAETVAANKNAAAETAIRKVNDLKAEKAKVEKNGRKVANIIATAKGEPVPFPEVGDDDEVDAEGERLQDPLPI